MQQNYNECTLNADYAILWVHRHTVASQSYSSRLWHAWPDGGQNIINWRLVHRWYLHKPQIFPCFSLYGKYIEVTERKSVVSDIQLVPRWPLYHTTDKKYWMEFYINVIGSSLKTCQFLAIQKIFNSKKSKYPSLLQKIKFNIGCIIKNSIGIIFYLAAEQISCLHNWTNDAFVKNVCSIHNLQFKIVDFI